MYDAQHTGPVGAAARRIGTDFIRTGHGDEHLVVDAVSANVRRLVETLAERIIDSQVERNGIHNPNYQGRAPHMRDQLVELRRQLIYCLYTVAADADTANILNVVVFANLAPEAPLALTSTRGPSVPYLLAHGTAEHAFAVLVRFGLDHSGLNQNLSARLVGA